jgi:hypothetical protein
VAHHKIWSIEEAERLRRHIIDGGSAARASAIFRRTVPAVREHARTLSLSFPTKAQLRRSVGASPPDRDRFSFRQRLAVEVLDDDGQPL